MRLLIDRDRCEANTLCHMEAPDTIALDDNDEPILPVDITDDVLPEVERAVNACPKAALWIED